MKQTIDEYQFIQAFEDYNRENNFSYEGKVALFDYLEGLEESCDYEIELDVIAICCEYTEYEDLEELQGVYYGIESIDDLMNHTTVIMIDDESFIVADY